MRGIRKTYPCIKYFLLAICLAVIPADNVYGAKESKYLDAVREFADNVLKYGRDTYGPKHTPLFVDGLNIHTHEPVKWRARGQVWILSNLASQQNLFRTLDGLTRITGNINYKQAAMDAIKYAFDNLRIPNGLLYWGNWLAYDAQTENICKLYRGHILKHNYPYYELMWEVNPKATEQFIESFWSAHILDWSNLGMNRIGYITEQLEKTWDYDYEGGPVFFKINGLSFHNAGSDLYYAGVLLHRLSGKMEPLVWSKRLAYRYVETRNPATGIGGSQYTRPKVDRAQLQFGDDFKGHVVLEGTLCPSNPWGLLESVVRPRICQLLLGETLGPDGQQFIQWALEELTAWGKVAYRRMDNSFVPILTDGTSLEGYVYTKDGYFGPEGTVVKSIPAEHLTFWTYTLAYRVTGEKFMWEMARSIAKGNGFGDIGILANDESKLNMEMDCSDPYALLGFLELYSKTQNGAFLKMASRIGDNIMAARFQNGFFVPSKQALYAKFDYIEPLVLMRLNAVINVRPPSVPRVWPSRSFFACPYDAHEEQEDTFVIYGRTEATELTRLFHEAAWDGKIDEVKSLFSKGTNVNAVTTVDYLTVQKILRISNILDTSQIAALTGTTTALHYAAQQGHTDVVDWLIAKGAYVNAENKWGETPLQVARKKGHTKIVELLRKHGAIE